MLCLWLLCVILTTIYTVFGVPDKECVDNCKCCKNELCGKSFGWPNVCLTGCIDGHIGARCYEPCKYDNCKICSGTVESQECETCYDGYYLGQNKDCMSQCPSNCKSCTSSTMCTECKDDFYNENGSTTCPYSYCPANCECNGQGDCVSCRKGFYDTSTSCSRPCPVNCLTCESEISCNECKSGFYNGYKYDDHIHVKLDNCTYTCRDTCKQCQSYNECSQCKDGKFGTKCQDDCSVGCKGQNCFIDSGQCECSPHFTGDNCISCIDGKYGSFCNQTCSKYCKGNSCERQSGDCIGCVNDNITGRTCETCKVGMYGELCNVMCPENCPNSKCERFSGNCSETCTNNFKGPICDQCKLGKYGENCEKNCSVNCAGNLCEKDSGTCFACFGNFFGKTCDECSAGYYGLTCDENCSQFCNNKTCNRNTGVCSYGCTSGYSGDKCCTNTENCVECFNNTGCKTCESGYYQISCNESCPEGCLGPCDIITGECSDCQDRKFGPFCDLNCSNSCKFEKGIDTRACIKSDGKCYRCHDGYFNPSCSDTCSSLCIGRICRQADGVCINGCEDHQKQPECILSEGQTPYPNIVGPVVGGIVAVLLLIVGIVAAVLFYRRRHRRQDSDHLNVNHNREPLKKKTEIAGTTGDGRVYENIQGKKQPRHSGNKEQEEVDVTAITIDERSEPNGSEYYDYTGVKVTNLFSYVTKDHVDLFVKDFQNLLKPDDLSILCKVAKKPENIASNRYNGIYPFDHSRVIIPGDPKFFINACYIDGYNRSKAYIASLGPTIKHTENFTTFWQMVWHEKSDIIVMLTNLREASGMKCEQYWPEIETEMCYGRINVKCRSLEEFAEYTVRCFTISKGKEERNLTQLHYTAWPDKGVPSEVTSLIDFRQRVKAAPVVLDGPVIVHCSAGVGRTGTYIALDILTEKGKAEHSVDVFNCVNKMREQRVNMVQTAEQYIFLHKALVHALTFECEALAAEELQSLSFENDGTFKKMYQTLKQEVDIDPEEEIAATEENRKKYADKSRRHSDIPGNRGRVRLYLQRKSGNHDYINAVFINSFKIKNLFIAAQTPQSNTVEDFLCMIYQQNCSCVVALEDPLQQSKKHDIGVYLPADNETFKYGDFTVTSSKFENKPQCTIKKLTIKHTNKGEEKIAYHFQYTKWGQDQKVADSPGDFVQFVKDVEKYVNQREADMPNVVVHCLNGYERNGLFCVVYKLLEKLEAEGQVSVVNVIRKVRTQRKLSISSVEQLKFCFQCISAYLESYNTYSNFAV